MPLKLSLFLGVYNTPNRTDELTYSYDPTEGTGGNGEKYLDFIETSVLPLPDCILFRGENRLKNCFWSGFVVRIDLT